MKRGYAVTMVVILFTGAVPGAAGEQIRGIVFQDNNANGVLDSGEKGLARVAVSDGKEIWLTGADGSFAIADPASRFVFLIKPSGYVPTGKWYFDVRREKAGPVQFGLKPREEKDCVFAHMSDIHGGFEQCRRELNAMEKTTPQPAFVIQTGDLSVGECRDAAHWADRIAMPAYNSIGNHDFKQAKRLYMDAFGPTWYSFNMGDVHFAVCDLNLTTGGPGNYTTGLSEAEGGWLKRDLEMHADRKIILAFHEMGMSPAILRCLSELGLAKKIPAGQPPYRAGILGAISGHGHVTTGSTRRFGEGFEEKAITSFGGQYTGPDSVTCGGFGATYLLSSDGGYRIYSYRDGVFDDMVAPPDGAAYKLAIVEVDRRCNPGRSYISHRFPYVPIYSASRTKCYTLVVKVFPKPAAAAFQWRILGLDGNEKVGWKEAVGGEQGFFGRAEIELMPDLLAGLPDGIYLLEPALKLADRVQTARPLVFKVGDVATPRTYAELLLKDYAPRIEYKSDLLSCEIEKNTGKVFNVQVAGLPLFHYILPSGTIDRYDYFYSSYRPTDLRDVSLSDTERGGKRIVAKGRWFTLDFRWTAEVGPDEMVAAGRVGRASGSAAGWTGRRRPAA